MQHYELMIVFPTTTEVTDKTASGLIQKLIGDAVTVDSVSVLGKKTLAYPIKKQKEGIYVVSQISSKTAVRVTDIEKKVQLGAEVLRFLLTVK